MITYTIYRSKGDLIPITFYFSKPNVANYPICIIVDGSTVNRVPRSVMAIYYRFYSRLFKINSAILTIEKYGVTNSSILEKEFLSNYTRGIRLEDHKRVIDYFISNPPDGWNGDILMIGISEGCIISTTLTEHFNNIIALINWCGAGDFGWKTELWLFLKSNFSYPMFKKEYDCLINNITKYCYTIEKEFLGFTYKYHADALEYPTPNYHKLHVPILVVTGMNDSLIKSSDLFVQKAEKVGVKIKYLRLPNTSHDITQRVKAVNQSFLWLKKFIK